MFLRFHQGLYAAILTVSRRVLELGAVKSMTQKVRQKLIPNSPLITTIMQKALLSTI